MATRHQYNRELSADDVNSKVKAFASKWGYSESEARQYLCWYALRRLDVLARYEGKKPAKKKVNTGNKGKTKKVA